MIQNENGTEELEEELTAAEVEFKEQMSKLMNQIVTESLRSGQNRGAIYGCAYSFVVFTLMVALSNGPRESNFALWQTMALFTAVFVGTILYKVRRVE